MWLERVFILPILLIKGKKAIIYPVTGYKSHKKERDEKNNTILNSLGVIFNNFVWVCEL